VIFLGKIIDCVVEEERCGDARKVIMATAILELTIVT
jgi:hypothetical protein